MKSKILKRYLLWFLISIIGFLLLNFNGFSWYNNDCTTYGVNMLARIGKYPSYFLADSVRENFTPQIISDYVILCFIKLGLSYQVAMIIPYIICCIILIMGILYGIRVFSKNDLILIEVLIIFFVGIVLLSFNALGNTISGNLLWDNSYYHQSIAIALVVWNIGLLQKIGIIINHLYDSNFVPNA